MKVRYKTSPLKGPLKERENRIQTPSYLWVQDATCGSSAGREGSQPIVRAWLPQSGNIHMEVAALVTHWFYVMPVASLSLLKGHGITSDRKSDV